MSILKRFAIFVVSIEIIYLVLFNIALKLPLTQDLINRIKPDKFLVSWDIAWTPFPFRVHASGVAANGQARSQQWQLGIPEASASISLLPLIFKTVKLHRIEARDITYYQRPRPRPDKDFTEIRKYFPPIKGRQLELDPPELPPRKTGKKGWTIRIQDMHASGEHSLWLYQIQAGLKGEATTDLSFVTRGGPFSLSNGEVDLALESMVLNGDREISRKGHIKGEVELQPFIIKENKGLKSLAFLKLNAELNAQTEGLTFLNVYLDAFEGMKLDGAGEIQGHVVLEHGKLLPESKLSVSAHELRLDLADYQIEGDGSIHVEVPENEDGADTSDPDMHFAIAFNKLDAYYSNQAGAPAEPLLTGNGLVVNGVGTNYIIPLGENRPQALSLTLSISSLKVPDLSDFQRFLPKKWAFKLHGGEGELLGQVSINQTSFSSDIRLSSEEADVGINDFRFSSDLEMELKVNSPSLETGRFDISGTHLKINETQISNEQAESSPWHASIGIEKGIIQLNLGEAETGVSSAKYISQVLMEQDIGTLLAAADEELKISGSISDLRWLNILMKNPYGLTIEGGGEITSDIVIKSGWLEKGTRLAIAPQELSVEVLDYVANGGGSVDLKVIKGGEFPDMALDISVNNAQFRRKLEDRAFIENVDIILQAMAQGANLNGQNEDMKLHLQIPSAKITDMSVYNQYLPEHSPLFIIGGEASLVVDILLERDDADGYVRLDTSNLSAIVDEQEISGELSAEINLTGGSPKDMEFEISGSALKLDKVKVIGEQASFRDEDWAAEFQFNKAHTVWKKPIQLDVEAELQMSDSIPIVSMMANQKGKHGWLGKALTIDDVVGNMHLQIANQQIVIPYAFAKSDNIDVGAKAIINNETRNGVLYVRYKALKGLLKINDGKRNIDVLKAKEKFDAYSTDEVLAAKGLSN